MKEAVADSNLDVVIRDTDIPTPGPGQVLIRVVVSGTNPKDWKVPKLWGAKDQPKNHGDDIAGYIDAVAGDVTGFKKGDRVAAFHEIMAAHGSWAEYAIAWAYTTFHVPDHTSFEEAATIPLAAMTAALALYQRLGLPLPWKPATAPEPLIVYGGATAVGAFAIRLAQLSNIHPVITVAGNGIPFVETIVSREKGDTVIDYRMGDDAVRRMLLEAAAQGQPIRYAVDAVSEKGSFANIAAALQKGSARTTTVLPVERDQIPDGVENVQTMVGTVHHQPAEPGAPLGDADFGAALFALFSRGLAKGWFRGHPHEVVPGGLNGIAAALRDLEAGRVHAKKLVVRIADTQEVGRL